jgi:hypothetical protein
MKAQSKCHRRFTASQSSRTSLLVVTFCVSAGTLFATCGGSTVCTNVPDFTTCVEASGSGTCQMASGVWSVPGTIHIGGNHTITGTANSASDVILQRTATLGANDIMDLASSGLSPTVEWITFDGNRNGISSLTCVPSPTFENPIADLALQDAGAAKVQYVNFISAPYWSLFLGSSGSGSSTVSYSNFGQGFSAHGISRTGPQSASRNAAIQFYGGSGTGAWFNNIAYAGEAAVSEYGGTGGGGTLQYIIGNSINSNRYEEPDGVPGGQIYIQGGVTYTSVADNVINGNYWITSMAQQSNPSEANYTLCAPGTNSDFPDGAFPYGIEGSATGDRYFNNSIIQNLGFGILLRPWNNGSNLDSVEISGYDPFCPEYCTYSPQYIENNTGCSTVANCFTTSGGWPVSMGVAGINVNNTAANQSGTGTVTHLVLDHVRSTSNNKFGISLDHVSGTGYEDTNYSPATSYPYACIESNGTNVNTGTSGNSLTNANYTNICP